MAQVDYSYAFLVVCCTVKIQYVSKLIMMNVSTVFHVCVYIIAFCMWSLNHILIVVLQSLFLSNS